MHETATDTGVSPEDEWIIESVKKRFDWPKKELSVAKLEWNKATPKRETEEAAPVGAKQQKWGTPTGPKKLEEARQKAKNRSRQEKLDRPYGGKEEPAKLPEWMSGKTGKHPMLPSKPPGKV